MVKRNTKIRTNEFLNKLKDEYEKGASLTQLNKKYHTDARYQFKKHNILQRNKEEYSKWRKIHRPSRINLHWNCETISNETEAYIIGFFMADGYHGNSQAGLRLKIEDKYMVKIIKDYFSKDITLQQDKNSCSFVISSSQICTNLNILGVYQHKTDVELHIPKMNENLYRHFIRGYFDGDGSVFIANKLTNNPYLKCNICSPTINILQEIKNVLNKININCTINKENRIGKILIIPNGSCIGSKDMYRLFIRQKEAIRLFYNFLYNNSSIFLKRKYDIFTNNLHLLIYKKHVNPELT